MRPQTSDSPAAGDTARARHPVSLRGTPEVRSEVCLITVPMLAEEWGQHPSTITAAIRGGRMRGWFRLGRAWVITLERLAEEYRRLADGAEARQVADRLGVGLSATPRVPHAGSGGGDA